MTRTRGLRAVPLALLLVALGWASPGAAGELSAEGKREAARLKDEAAAAYKDKDFPRALDRVERAHRLTPKDHELLRQVGSIKAMMGDREGAYEAYREYVRRCPKCMFAPTVKKIIREYEEENESEPAARQPGDRLKQAKYRYEEAYVIQHANPGLARKKLHEVLELAPEDNIYHAKARKLLEKLEGSP